MLSSIVLFYDLKGNLKSKKIAWVRSFQFNITPNLFHLLNLAEDLCILLITESHCNNSLPLSHVAAPQIVLRGARTAVQLENFALALAHHKEEAIRGQKVKVYKLQL